MKQRRSKVSAAALVATLAAAGVLGTVAVAAPGCSGDGVTPECGNLDSGCYPVDAPPRVVPVDGASDARADAAGDAGRDGASPGADAAVDAARDAASDARADAR